MEFSLFIWNVNYWNSYLALVKCLSLPPSNGSIINCVGNGMVNTIAKHTKYMLFSQQNGKLGQLESNDRVLLFFNLFLWCFMTHVNSTLFLFYVYCVFVHWNDISIVCTAFDFQFRERLRFFHHQIPFTNSFTFFFALFSTFFHIDYFSVLLHAKGH